MITTSKDQNVENQNIEKNVESLKMTFDVLIFDVLFGLSTFWFSTFWPCPAQTFVSFSIFLLTKHFFSCRTSKTILILDRIRFFLLRRRPDRGSSSRQTRRQIFFRRRGARGRFQKRRNRLSDQRNCSR